MRIARLEAIKIKIPFERKCVHGGVEHGESENAIVRLTSGGAVTGVGGRRLRGVCG